MAIYVRNEEGQLKPLEIPAIKGEKGEKGDSGVFVGDISEAPESAEIIVDDSDLGLTYLSEELIDDTTLSANKTWSSSKIEDFVLNNDNTVWLDQSGENLKIDNTKEGYLREIEIWGNTIQNEEDLSDIKHLGELYVDDEGEPILDDLGREQYKIEVKSSNYNRLYTNAEIVNLYNSMGYPNVKAELVDGKFSMKSRGYWNTPVKVFTGKPNTVYTFCVNTTGDYFKDSGLTLVKKYSSSVISYRTDSTGSFGFLVYPTLNEPFDFKIFEGQIENLNNIVDYIHKTTILLPCQLSKVGDVADRLYWDNEKGKYVVEKKIGVDGYINKINRIYDGGYPQIETQRFSKDAKNSEIIDMTGIFALSPDTQFVITSNWKKDIESIQFDTVCTNIRLLRTTANTVEEANDYLSNNPIRYYYKIKNPQLIDTNITEQIKLPTYINTTYITVNGGIQGSIKAKAPVDGSSVVNNLVQSNYELKQENEEIKAINEEQDEVINISLMATDEIFMMLEPLLDIATLSNENTTSKIADMYRIMVNKGLKKIEDIPQRYRVELTKDGE